MASLTHYTFFHLAFLVILKSLTFLKTPRKVKGIVTCKLPRGQYSVMMQMLGASMQAPMNLVRWLN